MLPGFLILLADTITIATDRINRKHPFLRNQVKLGGSLRHGLYCVVDTGYGLGRSLGDWKPALLKGRKYQMVKKQTESHVRMPVVWTNQWQIWISFSFEVCWGTAGICQAGLIWCSEFIASYMKNFLIAQGSVLVLCTKFNVQIGVDTLVTHANMKGFGLTLLFGDHRGFMPPQSKTKHKKVSFGFQCNFVFWQRSNT